MEHLNVLLESAPLFVILAVTFVGISGILVGVVQSLVGRELNLWPIQLSLGFVTFLAAFSSGSHQVVTAYFKAGAMAEKIARRQVVMEGYFDALVILKYALALIFLQTLTAAFGRACFMNGAKPVPFSVPKQGAAADELKREEAARNVA